MSNSGSVQKPAIIITKPLILKKDQLFLKHSIKIRPSLYKEDIIYESKKGDFLGGDCRDVTIVNKLNRLTNSSVTIAKCSTRTEDNIEKTSERVANLIGQRNYDIVFSALCSVISQELKVRAILALLTANKPKVTATQTFESISKKYSDAECQTEDPIDDFFKIKPKKRVKRQALVPYVAKEVEKPVKKIVIHPSEFKDTPELTELELQGDNSDDSLCSFSALSVSTTNSLLYNPSSLLKNLDKFTRQDSVSENSDNTCADMTVTASPRPGGMLFGHPNISSNTQEKRQMLKAQAISDWNSCDKPDEDGNLPIHEAVKDNDIELLIRQCLVLTAKKLSVDRTVNGDWTPLKMAILKNLANMTALLLHFGANPLLTDTEQKTSMHHAAEMPHAHLQAIVEHCMKNPRKVLVQNDDLWQDNYEDMPVDRLSRLLLARMCSMCDVQGYTPLMLASKMGNYENVELLIRIAPTTINKQMPTCGNTALYLSIGAACTDCIERGDKTVVAPNFSRTIEALVAKGADPGIDNRSGSNVNILLTEFNIAPLSTLVANKLTSIKYFDGIMPETTKNFDKYMLVKNKEGLVDIMEVSKQKVRTDDAKKKMTNKHDEPVMLQDTQAAKMTSDNNDAPNAVLPTVGAKDVVNAKADKPVIVQNILLPSAPRGARKRKSTDNKFENNYKKFLENNCEPDKNVHAGKAAVIKELKITPAKHECHKPAIIRQPAKKRIKNMNSK